MNDLLFSSLVLVVGIAICPLLIIMSLAYGLLLTIKKISDRIIAQKRWLFSPCPHCFYFHDCPELPCAVNPDIVLTKKALDCRDFKPTIEQKIYNQKVR